MRCPENDKICHGVKCSMDRCALQDDITPPSGVHFVSHRDVERRSSYPDGNPKDTIGATKLMMDCVPDSAIAVMALAFAEGLFKYGRFNWRAFPVRFSIYDGAAMRHRAKLRAGEWEDPKTRVPHVGSMMACYAIINDARLSGTLIDDRPPAQPALIIEIDKADAEIQNALKEMFKEFSPKHWQLSDDVPALKDKAVSHPSVCLCNLCT
jgi:hypothetical protein